MSFRFPPSAAVLLVAGIATLGVAACSDVAGVGRQQVSLSIATPRATLASAAIASPDAIELRVIAGNSHTLDLQHAYLTLGDVRLHADDDADKPGDSDADEDHDDGDHAGDLEDAEHDDHDGDQNFHSGPTTIELPLDGGVITPLDALVPQGTYDKLKADLQTLHLTGTYDGKAFDVTLPIHRQLHMKLEPSLVVAADGTHPNVTLTVDIAHCFVDASGTPIDPTRLATDPVLAASLRACLAHDFHAFRDRDRDGDEDHDD